MKNEMICPCSSCREKPKRNPRYLIGMPPVKKRKSPLEVFVLTLLAFAALAFAGYYFWT